MIEREIPNAEFDLMSCARHGEDKQNTAGLLDKTVDPEPSELVKASPFLMECFRLSPYRLPELEHRAKAALLLRGSFSKIEYYRKRGWDYWTRFSSSRPNWISPENLERELARRGIELKA